MYGFQDWYVPVNYSKTNTVTHTLPHCYQQNTQRDKETIFDFRDAHSNTYGLLPDIEFFHVSDTDWYFTLSCCFSIIANKADKWHVMIIFLTFLQNDIVL